jgi:hypothetical protein
MKIELRPKQNTAFERSNPLHQPTIFRYLPLVVLSLLLLNLLATCSNTSTLQRAVKHTPNIYVQTVEGTTLQGQVVDPLYRSDATVRRFAEDWLKLAFTWKSSAEKAEAFVKERGIVFPREFHHASMAIQPGYREAYIDSQAKKYQRLAFGNYVTGQHQAYVRIFEPEQSKVQLIEKGVWDVTIVATRTHATNNSIFAQEVFNRIIRVRAINPASDQRLWGDKETHLGKLLNEMQQQGLQITQISEF